jgi:acyl carrier protein
MDELNIEMADILEVDSVADTDQLDGFAAWDSLAILSLLAFVDEKYNVQLFKNDFENVKTLADLKKLVESKK